MKKIKYFFLKGLFLSYKMDRQAFGFITKQKIKQMKKFLENKWIKILFSLSIMLSAIPSIYQDFTYGHQGEWTHYGMMIVGVLYFIESILWTMDLWKN